MFARLPASILSAAAEPGLRWRHETQLARGFGYRTERGAVCNVSSRRSNTFFVCFLVEPVVFCFVGGRRSEITAPSSTATAQRALRADRFACRAYSGLSRLLVACPPCRVARFSLLVVRCHVQLFYGLSALLCFFFMILFFFFFFFAAHGSTKSSAAWLAVTSARSDFVFRDSPEYTRLGSRLFCSENPRSSFRLLQIWAPGRRTG